jgi:hypothetical protein
MASEWRFVAPREMDAMLVISSDQSSSDLAAQFAHSLFTILSLEIIWIPYEAALKRYLITHSFYSVDEFLMFTNKS